MYSNYYKQLPFYIQREYKKSTCITLNLRVNKD
jgi:hypothetical protein